MKLHEDKKLFRQAIQITADQMKIAAIYVEKDYWVTYALLTIFKHESISKHTVFKGGTALSKCYDIIHRFSEDIDLVILTSEDESNNQRDIKIKNISVEVNKVLPEIEIDGLTIKKGMNRKTVHTYNKEFQGSYNQVRDVIVVEATRLGYFEPYTTKPVCSFVGNMMINNKQTDIAEKHGLLPFDVLVLEPTRTLCEKIMSLVKFSYTENPVEDLIKKIRHTYDLHQLLQQEELLNFFNSSAFEEMLLKVANDDVVSYKSNNEWLMHHPNKALIFRYLDVIWNDLKTAYNGNFIGLVYGIFPKDEAILKTLNNIKERLSNIKWSVEIPPKQ